MRTFLAFTFCALILSCSSSQTDESEGQNVFKPRIFGITVSDMERSMNWYTSTLNFERDTVMHFESSGITVGMMHLGDFYIELIGFENSIFKADLDLPKEHSNLHGFFKMGFQADNIQELYARLSASADVSIVAPLDDLPEIENYDFPDKYFLITDPDGNYIQFFSKKPSQSSMAQEIEPFLAAISTPDIEATIEWYAQHIGAKSIGEIVGNPGNERALLEKDGFILEIGEFADDVGFENLEVPEGVWRSKVHGMTKLSFLVDSIQEPYQTMKLADLLFDFDLTERKSMAGDRYFMIQDLNGTSLQFFEVDK